MVVMHISPVIEWRERKCALGLTHFFMLLNIWTTHDKFLQQIFSLLLGAIFGVNESEICFVIKNEKNLNF